MERMRRAPQNRILARKNPEGDAGLTLLELMITIAILAVLAAVVVPVFTNQRAKADDATTMERVGVIGRFLINGYIDNSLVNSCQKMF